MDMKHWKQHGQKSIMSNFWAGWHNTQYYYKDHATAHCKNPDLITLPGHPQQAYSIAQSHTRRGMRSKVATACFVRDLVLPFRFTSFDCWNGWRTTVMREWQAQAPFSSRDKVYCYRFGVTADCVQTSFEHRRIALFTRVLFVSSASLLAHGW